MAIDFRHDTKLANAQTCKHNYNIFSWVSLSIFFLIRRQKNKQTKPKNNLLDKTKMICLKAFRGIGKCIINHSIVGSDYNKEVVIITEKNHSYLNCGVDRPDARNPHSKCALCHQKRLWWDADGCRPHWSRAQCLCVISSTCCNHGCSHQGNPGFQWRCLPGPEGCQMRLTPHSEVPRAL